MPKTPYVFWRNTVCFYLKHRMFVSQIPYVFRRNIVCSYLKHSMFLREIRYVFGRNTVRFCRKWRMFLCCCRFFNIDLLVLSRQNLNVLCRMNLKDFRFSRKKTFGKNKRFLDIMPFSPERRRSLFINFTVPRINITRNIKNVSDFLQSSENEKIRAIYIFI